LFNRVRHSQRSELGTWIVVYLNIGEYGIRQKETEPVIAEIKARHSEAFVAITVLWKGKLY